jgi:superfamily I DNA/RNA helicase
MPRRQFYIKETELDDFQHNLVNRKLDASMVVSGCAGSGKSVIALHKAKAVQEAGKGTYKFIVFTKALDRYMSDGIATLGLNAANFTYYEDWKNKGRPLADFMIVDEAQDFSEEEINGLKGAKLACFFFGDSSQSIYNGIGGKKTLLMPEIVGITKFEFKTLEFNYRLPKKIARLAAQIGVGGDMAELEGRCREEGTELPHVDRYPTREAELDAICAIIEARHFEDIGILFPTNNDVRVAYQYLRNKGKNVEAKYEVKPNWRESRLDLDFSANNTNPKLMTYHSAKGLQFEAVFLPDCHCARPNDRSPLYVAMTRSYQSLYIMHTAQLSPFFDCVSKTLYQTGTAKVADKDVTI